MNEHDRANYLTIAGLFRSVLRDGSSQLGRIRRALADERMGVPIDDAQDALLEADAALARLVAALKGVPDERVSNREMEK